MTKNKIQQNVSKSNNKKEFSFKKWIRELTNFYKYSRISPLIYLLYSLGISQETIAGLWGVSRQRVGQDYPIKKKEGQ